MIVAEPGVRESGSGTDKRHVAVPTVRWRRRLVGANNWRIFVPLAQLQAERLVLDLVFLDDAPAERLALSLGFLTVVFETRRQIPRIHHPCAMHAELRI